MALFLSISRADVLPFAFFALDPGLRLRVGKPFVLVRNVSAV